MKPTVAKTEDGNWALITEGIEIATGDNIHDCYLTISGYFGPYKPELFAAAPELLAALKSVRPLIADMARSWEFEAQQLKRIDALIAKADCK